jgi:hypothetical protein
MMPSLAPRQSALLLLAAKMRVRMRTLGGPGSGVRGLGDVAGHEFHGNQWKEGKFDFVESAKTNSRHDYIARYVEKETSKKAGRDLTNGMHVKQTKDGWSYGFKSPTLPMTHVKTSADLYERILRSPLNYFVQKAEAFRADVHASLKSASRHPESAIHRAADAHYKPMLLAVQASFNIGRKAYKSGGVDAAVSAIKRALLIALPPVLIKTFVAGGNVGVGMVPKRRAAETVMRCSRCEYPTRDKEQEHPGICVCGGYIDDVPNLNLRAAADKPFDIRFDVSDPAAAKWAREHTSKIADDISQTSKDRINEAIATALEGDGLDAAYDTILSAVGDESRADMIARTESMDSANQGALAGFNAAQDAGLLPANATKVWIASPDACDDCIELDDEEVAIDEDFSSGDDAPPAHPNCRCSVGIGAGA